MASPNFPCFCNFLAIFLEKGGRMTLSIQHPSLQCCWLPLLAKTVLVFFTSSLSRYLSIHLCLSWLGKRRGRSSHSLPKRRDEHLTWSPLSPVQFKKIIVLCGMPPELLESMLVPTHKWEANLCIVPKLGFVSTCINTCLFGLARMPHFRRFQQPNGCPSVAF